MNPSELVRGSQAFSWMNAGAGWCRPASALVLALALSACGGGGGGGGTEQPDPAATTTQPDPPTTTTPPSTSVNAAPLVLSETLAPGDPNCKAGGTKFSTGKDADGNGTLNDGEATVTYACNEVPQAMPWIDVTDPSQVIQAQSNTGYSALSDQQVTIRLPAAPLQNEVVRINGLGTGGWKVVQNEGQTIVTDNLPIPWTKIRTATEWDSVSVSGNGELLLAVEEGDGGINTLHVSTNGGVDWAVKTPGQDDLLNVSEQVVWVDLFAGATSSDGKLLIVSGEAGTMDRADPVSFVLISRDEGDSWTAHETPVPFELMASSSTGGRLAAVGPGGRIYTSLDGQDWGEGRTVLDPDGSEIRGWYSIASSDTGMELVAGGDWGIYTSIDGGQNWIPSPDMIGRDVYSVAMASATGGKKLVAAVGAGPDSRIFVSDDGGLEWQERGPDGDWLNVASSADGKTLAASIAGEAFVYISRNGGETWVAQDKAPFRSFLAISGDGTRIVSVLDPDEGDEDITTAPPTQTTVTDGWLSGGQYDSVDLLYVGEGVFVVPTFTSNQGGGGFAVH